MCAVLIANWKYLFYTLWCIVLLTGCGLAADGNSIEATTTGVSQNEMVVPSPETARDVAMAYLRTYHPGKGPSEIAFWFEEDGTMEALAGTFVAQYRYESWVVMVSYPTTASDGMVYTLTAERSAPNLVWQGMINSNGEVVEISYTFDDEIPTAAPATHTPIQSPTETQTQAPRSTTLPTGTAISNPTKTATPFPAFTSVPNPCNKTEFIRDITIQDGTTFSPGANFTKIWRMKNVGTCAWTRDYDLVFVDGNQMGADQSQGLHTLVKPGESVDISVEMKAPQEPGDYRGMWMLRDFDGELFGLGERAEKSFWVSIAVADFKQGDFQFDFALNFCSANWRSETRRLSCPGFVNSVDGFVNLLPNADLENRREDEPALWVHPNETRYGWIEGTYPVYKVETGDRFMAWVGCLQGYNMCNLTFYLDSMDTDGKVNRMGEWVETYDGQVTEIDMDLSDFEGESLRFILGVEVNTKNVDDAQGFWFVPRIE